MFAAIGKVPQTLHLSEACTLACQVEENVALNDGAWPRSFDAALVAPDSADTVCRIDPAQPRIRSGQPNGDCAARATVRTLLGLRQTDHILDKPSHYRRRRGNLTAVAIDFAIGSLRKEAIHVGRKHHAQPIRRTYRRRRR